MIYQGMCILTN